MKARAVVYVRKSGGGDPSGTYADQRAAVLRLAEVHGDKLADPGDDRKDAVSHPDWFVDWRISGGNTREGRPAYNALLTEAEAGTVATVYAFDEERLSRDVEFGVQLLKLAERYGFRVVTPSGIISDPNQRTMVEMRWVFAGDFRRKASQRAQAREARRRANGEPSGRANYGYEIRQVDGKWQEIMVNPDAIRHVVDTYRTHRSGNATAQALNAEGIPAPRSGLWRSGTIVRIINREAPELLPRKNGRQRRTPSAPSLFTGLVRCPCGQIMSPNGNGSTRVWTCQRGLALADHPRPYSISENAIMEFATAEATRLALPFDAVDMSNGDAAEERRRIVSRRARFAEMYGEGDLSTERWAAVKAETAAALAALDEQEHVMVDIPHEVPWDAAPDDVRRILAAIWKHIELGYVGDRLRPVKAEWRLPPEYVARG